MKSKEIRDLSAEEIQQRIIEEEKEVVALRFQHAIAQLEDPLVLRRKRREVARMKTILLEKERTAEA